MQITTKAKHANRWQSFAKKITIQCNDGIEPMWDTVERSGLTFPDQAPEDCLTFCGITHVRICHENADAIIEFRDFPAERAAITREEDRFRGMLTGVGISYKP